MADSVRITNMPESGSRERVAFDMAKWLSSSLPGSEGEERIQAFLDLYADCYKAAGGGRSAKR